MQPRRVPCTFRPGFEPPRSNPPVAGIVAVLILVAAAVALYVLATGDAGRPEDPLQRPQSAPVAPGESATAAAPHSPAERPAAPPPGNYDDGVVDEHELGELLAVSLDADDPLRQVLTVELLTRVALDVCDSIPDEPGTVEEFAAWVEAAAATPTLDAVNPRDRGAVVTFAAHYACQARFARFAGLA